MTHEELKKRLGTKTIVVFTEEAKINKKASIIYMDNKKYTYAKLVVEVQEFTELTFGEAEDFVQETLTLFKENEINPEESESNVEFIGSGTLINGFLEYVNFDDSEKIFLVKKLPMEDYHLNSTLDLNYNEAYKGAKISIENVLLAIEAYRSHLKNNAKVIPYKVDIVRALDEQLVINTKAELSEYIKTITYEKQDIDYLDIMITSMLPKDNLEHKDSYVNIFRHWLWCVKRNALDLKVVYHIFPVLTGHQGTAKTFLLNLLVKSFKKSVLSNATFRNITEDRSAAIDSAKLVWIFDELQYADKAALESLKNWVTAELMSYRPMGTNASVQVQKCSMGIGSSNKALNTTIVDSTGNRRFIDFPVKNASGEWLDIFRLDEYKDLFKADGIAWQSIWKNIDETKTNGYIDINETGTMAILAENYTGTSEYAFFKEIASESKMMVHIKKDIFHKMYEAFCRNSGNRPKSNNIFHTDFNKMAKVLNWNYNPEAKNISGTKYVSLPLLNEEYRELFKAIPITVPGVKHADYITIFHATGSSGSTNPNDLFYKPSGSGYNPPRKVTKTEDNYC